MKFDISKVVAIESEYSELKNKLDNLPREKVEGAILKRHNTIIEELKNDVQTRQRGWWWITEITWCEAGCAALYIGGAVASNVVYPIGHVIAYTSFVTCVLACNK